MRIIDNSGAVLSEMAKSVAVALEAIGLQAENYAQINAPVDTGRLRDNITHIVDDHSVTIGTNVEYAPYVELGTSKRSEHPFLMPAIADHFDEWQNILKSQLTAE